MRDANHTNASISDHLLFAQYLSFSLGDSSSNYTLHLSGYDPSSTAGDSMLNKYYRLDNMQFSTKDRDNDRSKVSHCAQGYFSGWWFNRCSYSSLNGRWGLRNSFGLLWRWSREVPHGQAIFATFTEMKVRRH